MINLLVKLRFFFSYFVLLLLSLDLNSYIRLKLFILLMRYDYILGYLLFVLAIVYRVFMNLGLIMKFFFEFVNVNWLLIWLNLFNSILKIFFSSFVNLYYFFVIYLIVKF